MGRHCYIAGRVQGVGYRAATRRKALELGLTGWVRNLADQRVEAVFYGSEEQLNLMCQWLQKGPALAKVTELRSEPIAWQSCTEFKIEC